jgi:hypothetical protein
MIKAKIALRTVLVFAVVTLATVISTVPVAAWPVATGP